MSSWGELGTSPEFIREAQTYHLRITLKTKKILRLRVHAFLKHFGKHCRADKFQTELKIV